MLLESSFAYMTTLYLPSTGYATLKGFGDEEKWMSHDDTLCKKLIKHVQYVCSLPVCIIMGLGLWFIAVRLQSKRNRGIRSREFEVRALHPLLHEK